MTYLNFIDDILDFNITSIRLNTYLANLTLLSQKILIIIHLQYFGVDVRKNRKITWIIRPIWRFIRTKKTIPPFNGGLACPDPDSLIQDCGDCVLLGWIGMKPVEDPYVAVGQIASIFFFLTFLVFIPAFGKFETFLLRNKDL